MYRPFIIGKKVYLRGLEKEDLKNLVGWTDDTEVTHYMFMGDKPASLDSLIEQWEKETRS